MPFLIWHLRKMADARFTDMCMMSAYTNTISRIIDVGRVVTPFTSSVTW